MCERVHKFWFSTQMTAYYTHLLLFYNRICWRTFHISVYRAASFFLGLHTISRFGGSVISLNFPKGSPVHILTSPFLPHICFLICILCPFPPRRIFTAFQNSLKTNKMTDDFAIVLSKYFCTYVISLEQHITGNLVKNSVAAQ